MRGEHLLPSWLWVGLALACTATTSPARAQGTVDASVSDAAVSSDASLDEAADGGLDGGASGAGVDTQTDDAPGSIPALAHPTTSLPPVPPPEPPTRTLRVALAGSEPFVVHSPDGPAGISVDVFDAVATRARINYTFVQAPSAAAAVAAVARGEVDLAVGPISITAERARYVDFTQPYFTASLGIASPESLSLWERIKPFLSRAFIVGVGGLSLVLLLIGTLIWLCERRQNPEHFPPAPLHGIANGAWFALVTMTTVGYGDRAPVSVAGRLVAGAWMVASMVIASSLIAGIATALTLARVDSSSIESAADLAGKPVAVVEGTTAVRFVRSHDARPVVAETLPDALRLVSEGHAEAIVFDRPALSYALTRDPSIDISLAEASYEPQGYGFVIPSGSDLGHRLDVALLDLAGSRQMELIRDEWLPE